MKYFHLLKDIKKLECDENNVSFYKKFNFYEDENTDDEMISMMKLL